MKNFFSKIILLATIFVFPFGTNAQIVAPNDPYNSQLWYLSKLRMSQAWNYSQGQGITVAIIDAGVDIDHPDLINKIWVNQREVFGDKIDNDNNGYVDDVKGWDFLDNDNEPKPVPVANCDKKNNCDFSPYYHGTAVSGIVGAESDNAFGISGLAPQAKIMPLRVLDSSGSGNSSDVISAMNYAINNGAKVINMSFVGPNADPGLTEAIERAYNLGVAVVVAAGNKENSVQINLDQNPRYPVCSRGSKGQKISFGVGAHDENDRLATFSNYGSTCIDLLAPGDNIFGLVANEPALGFNDYYANGFRGTSLAAPMASAAVAMVRSYDPSLTLLQVFELLRTRARNVDSLNAGYEGKLGGGALDILNVFQYLDSIKPTEINGLSYGDVFKVNGISTVYYYGRDGKRYVFPDVGTYMSWYPDFSSVKTVPVEVASQLALGGVVTYRPGAYLVKIATDPKVYAVDINGTLKWITSETSAIDLYGTDWSLKVRDLSDAYVASYKFGSDIVNSSEYNLLYVLNSSQTINQDKNL